MTKKGDGFAPHPSLFGQHKRDGAWFWFDNTQTNKPNVVLLHGNGDEAETWRCVWPFLGKTRHLLAPDLPGFGRSQTMGDGTLEDMVAALLVWLEGRSLGPVHLVGSSMGAVVAAMLAAQHPDRVVSLAIVGGAAPCLGGFTAGEALAGLLTPGTGEAYYTGLRDQGQDVAFETLGPYYANLLGLPESEQRWLRERVWARVWSDTQRAAFFAGLRSLFAPRDTLVPALRGLPTLLVWGEADRIVPLQTGLHLAELLNVPLVQIAGAGHLPHQEQPETFVQTLMQFWQTQAAPTQGQP